MATKTKNETTATKPTPVTSAAATAMARLDHAGKQVIEAVKALPADVSQGQLYNWAQALSQKLRELRKARRPAPLTKSQRLERRIAALQAELASVQKVAAK